MWTRLRLGNAIGVETPLEMSHHTWKRALMLIFDTTKPTRTHRKPIPVSAGTGTGTGSTWITPCTPYPILITPIWAPTRSFPFRWDLSHNGFRSCMASANGTVNTTLNIVHPINVSSHKLHPVVFGSIQISKSIFISAIAKFYYNDQTRIISGAYLLYPSQ